MTSKVIPVLPFDMVIFGSTGDLSQRKLLPALFRRDASGQMPEQARIIGLSRLDYNQEQFREFALNALNKFIPAAELKPEIVERFLNRLHHLHNDVTKPDGWDGLRDLLNEYPDRIRMYYLSVGPSLFGTIAQGLAHVGLNGPNDRLVVEKPLGHDLASAQKLNHEITTAFNEQRIYRIDHYLGKETVQNLMALRFANALFEPLWNASAVDHVQITAAETIGVGTRGGYYDTSGAMRDMVQNHLIQLLCLMAMEAPYAFNADAVRDEKLKVLRSLRPIKGQEVQRNTVRAQYLARGEDPSYVEEAGNPDSHTETYVAIKAEIDNWRWAGVPFYLRTGKRLRSRLTEIVVTFKEPAHSVFPNTPLQCNKLIIRLQPDEGLQLNIMTKDPGPGGFRLRTTTLDMTYAEGLGPDWRMPDAYERLLMDVVRGDQTLFMRGDEVEAAWRWIDPILNAWEDSNIAPSTYESGSEGPIAALELMARDGRRWREMVV
ncbi:glucose-6-phosphate dehydrogenase [Thiofilum flexile]|uniref:glucose-6-phosphate dehydrogenase n=1 Tax=Thiofilum flexile TaxID=125627 RepID=UPI0003649B9C|nr:glucose-6-phosphate dehydrogenase [Thiofilum flexile]